jgi:hypothetical protein
MLSLEEIGQDPDIMDCLDLTMTSEKAISLYLEWGAFSAHGQDFVRSGNDATCFFTVDAWERPARVFLVKQTNSGREEICRVDVPQTLVDGIVESYGGRKGTYNISEALQEWIGNHLY